MRWLTPWSSGVLLACCLWGAALATEVPPADAEQVRSVIQAQLDAFADDDADRAFDYAAPSIRNMFGDPERFMAMVRTGYAVVYRPASVNFLPPEVDGKAVVQAVRMADAAGALWLVIYLVERQDDGTWRIGGCQVAPLRGRST